MSSPPPMGSWKKYTDPEENFAFRKSQKSKTRSHALPRYNHTQPKKSIILNDANTKILIPNLDLLSLHNINYLDLVRNIHQANNGSHISAAKMGRIWENIVTNIYHFEPEDTKNRKMAEANSEEAKIYWRTVSDHQLASRQQRVRPVAADFFDDYPQHVGGENDHTVSTTAGSCQKMRVRDVQMVDEGRVLADQEELYRGKSEKPPAFLITTSTGRANGQRPQTKVMNQYFTKPSLIATSSKSRRVW